MFDRGAAAKLRCIALAEQAKHPTIRGLLDFRAAVVVLDASEVREITEANVGNAIEVPTGALVDPAYRPLARTYAQAMRQAGHIRLVFTELDAALTWLGASVPALELAREYRPPAPPAAPSVPGSRTAAPQ